MPAQAPFQPSPAALRRLHDLLRQGTLLAHWQAGEVLNTLIGEERSAYGQNVMAMLSTALKKLGGVAASASNLHFSRLLRRFWTLQDVRAAEKAGMTWHDTVQLLSLDGLARGLPQDRRQALIRQRQALAHRYRRDAAGRKKWYAQLSALKAACVPDLGAGARAKQIAEARQAIDYRLAAALERLTTSISLLPSKRRHQALKLGKRLESLRNAIEAVHLSAARKLRKKA